MLQIHSRRTKNIRSSTARGRGQTAVAEGLAHRIFAGDVPENLLSKRI